MGLPGTPSHPSQQGAGNMPGIPAFPPTFAEGATLPPAVTAPLAPAEALEKVSTLALEAAERILRAVLKGERLPFRLDPEATAALGHVGLTTSEIVQSPRRPIVTRDGRTRTERAQLRTNVETQLVESGANDRMREGETHLAEVLDRDLNSFTDISIVDVHIAPNAYGGTVVLPETIIAFPDEQTAQDAKLSLHALFSSPLGKLPVVDLIADSAGRHAVRIRNVNEYDVRNAEEGTNRLEADYQAKVHGVRLSPTKMVRARLQEAGHTFNEWLQTRIQTREQRFTELKEGFSEKVTYKGFGPGDPRSPRLVNAQLAQSAILIFEFMRMAINGEREEGHINFETNPDPEAPRINIMHNVNLSRSKVTAAQHQHGPGETVVPGVFEKLQAWRARTVVEIKQNRWQTVGLLALRLGEKALTALTGGVETVGSALLSPFTNREKREKLLLGRREYQAEKRAYELGRTAVQDAMKTIKATIAQRASTPPQRA